MFLEFLNTHSVVADWKRILKITVLVGVAYIMSVPLKRFWLSKGIVSALIRQRKI